MDKATEYLHKLTEALWDNRNNISLPDDIMALVNDAGAWCEDRLEEMREAEEKEAFEYARKEVAEAWAFQRSFIGHSGTWSEEEFVSIMADSGLMLEVCSEYVSGNLKAMQQYAEDALQYAIDKVAREEADKRIYMKWKERQK